MARRTALVGEWSGNLLVPRSGLEKAGGPSHGIRCGNKCIRFVRAAEHVFRTGAKIRAYESNDPTRVPCNSPLTKRNLAAASAH